MMKYQYCPMCGKKYGDNKFVCSRCGYVIYQNSVPAVGAVILNKENKILMERRAIEPFKGKWDFAGGFMELGEDPLDALNREIEEELHISVIIDELLTIVTDIYGENEEYMKYTLNLFYLAFIEAGEEPQISDEVMEYRWFDVDKLPEEIAFQCTLEVIRCIKKKGIV